MIELRDLAEEDCERLFLWRRRPEVARWMCGEPFGVLSEHRQWFERFRRDDDSRGYIILQRGRPVGFLTLKGLSGSDRRAEWGWYLGEDEARGRGVGRAAQALGLDQAFGPLALHKVCAEVLADNLTALKAQTAAGFRREGYLVAHAHKEGAWRDVALLGILAEEWRARRGEVLRSLVQARLISAA